MSCYLTALSDSNIYCRPPMSAPITQSQPGCHPSFKYPPICQSGMQHCNHTLGGGCCPLGTSCTVDGCTDVLEFVFPSGNPSPADAARSQPLEPSDGDVGGCKGVADVVELLSHDQFPTSSTVPNSGVATQTGTWQPATWTVTVTGSKTGEVCDASAMTTAGVASGAVRRMPLLGSAWGHTCKLFILVTACLVLGVGFFS
jgi:hypothetical protein